MPNQSTADREPQDDLTMGLSKETIIDGYALTFDPGDKRNGSLYLCEPLETTGSLALAELIDGMRAAGLWSEAEAKQVPDEHRPAYKAQLVLLAAGRYKAAGEFLIARFDHPQYPSDDGRWQAWQQFFNTRFTSPG